MQIPLIWLYFMGGLVTGSLMVGISLYLMMKVRKKVLLAEMVEMARREQEQQEIWTSRWQDLKKENELLQERLQERGEELAGLRVKVERIVLLERELERKEEALDEMRSQNVTLEKEVSDLKARIAEEREQSNKSLKELKEARETMQKEFKLLASKIIEEHGRQFSNLSKERVEEVLKPLQQQVGEFRKRIEEVHTQETKELGILLGEIKNLKELNLKIGEDAVSLTKALRGEKKQQGIWGEMVLERVLEASGLREGEEYEREVTLSDANKQRYRPDVVVHLPNKRDIIIDAKTSLVDYEKYVNAEEEEDRSLYAKDHLNAIKTHIDRLAEKGYANLEGVNTLDFIFMFIPIEGALMLALQSDPTLYDKAFRKHIVLVSPTTLLVALRAVENTWRHERQNRNALEIARRAGALYDKFVGFTEDLQKVGRQLDMVRKSYDGAWNKLKDGRGNIIWQVEEIKELGARASKQISEQLLDEAHKPVSTNLS